MIASLLFTAILFQPPTQPCPPLTNGIDPRCAITGPQSSPAPPPVLSTPQIPPVPQPATVTVSQQQSPFPLSKGLSLYSALVCSPVSRTVSAGQIRQAAEGLGIAVQDASLNGQSVATAASRTPMQKILTGTKWANIFMSGVSGTISFVKSQQPTFGNARTWTEVSIGTGGLGALIGIMQPFLQTEANNQAATITQGVQAALMQADGLYSVQPGNCVRGMFFGTSGAAVSKGVIQ